jgi:hypothetical protein
LPYYDNIKFDDDINSFKDIYKNFSNSTFFNNLSKKDKREYNYNFFCEKINDNLFSQTNSSLNSVLFSWTICLLKSGKFLWTNCLLESGLFCFFSKLLIKFSIIYFLQQIA